MMRCQMSMVGRVSVRRRLQIRYFARNVKRLKIVIEKFKGWSFLWHSIPALKHQSIDTIWKGMTDGLWHSITIIYLVDYFSTVHTFKLKETESFKILIYFFFKSTFKKSNVNQ